MDEIAAQQRLVTPELDLDESATMASVSAAEDETVTSPTARSPTASTPSSPTAAKRRWVVGAAGGLATAGLLLTAGAALARHLPATASSLAAPAAKPSQQLWGGGNGPSLFCWCIMDTSGYERDILEAQFGTGAGIFECDDQVVFSEESVLLGGEFETEGIGALSSQLGGQGPMATSSWVNTESFFRAWEALRENGRFSGYDWVIKVDPDTVLFPSMLKQHIVQRGMGGQVNLYLSNCPNVDNGFYGCVEAISGPAFTSFMDRFDICRQTLPYEGWGEDLFAQKCMDSVGVGNQGDFDLVADGNCHGGGGAPPCIPGRPAFHPFKSAEAWLQCWNQAGGGGEGGGSFNQQGDPRAQGYGQPFPGEEGEFMQEPAEGGAFLGPRHDFPVDWMEPEDSGEGGEGGGSWWESLGLPSYHRRK